MSSIGTNRRESSPLSEEQEAQSSAPPEIKSSRPSFDVLGLSCVYGVLSEFNKQDMEYLLMVL
jgi:hypothetical protein